MSFEPLDPTIIAFLRRSRYWSEASIKDYEPIADALGLVPDSASRTFYTHMPAATIPGRLFELLGICWFALHGSYLDDLASTRSTLRLPDAYIPLDAFEGDGGFFYNTRTDEVLELEFGDKLVSFWAGTLAPQFSSFNTFLRWYFQLDGV